MTEATIETTAPADIRNTVATLKGRDLMLSLASTPTEELRQTVKELESVQRQLRAIIRERSRIRAKEQAVEHAATDASS